MSMKTYYQEECAGTVYERESYMHGGGWISYERGVNPGAMREIRGIVSKAWTVTGRGLFRKPRVHWIAIDPCALRDVPTSEKVPGESAQ